MPTTLLLKLPRNQDITAEPAKTFLSALTQVNQISFWGKLFGGSPAILALEVASINQQIVFLLTCDDSLVTQIETQLQSNYPLVTIEKIEDPLHALQGKPLHIKEMTTSHSSYYPIATYDKFTELDPLSSVLTIFSKVEPTDFLMLQIAINSINASWQGTGASFAENGTKKEDGSYSPRSDKNIIIEKVSFPGFGVTVRIIGTNTENVSQVASTLAVFNRTNGSSFKSVKNSILTSKNKTLDNALKRKVTGKHILNIQELATLWHLPSEKIKVSGIAWGTKVLSEAPENLPVAEGSTDEQKAQIAFFAKTTFKNKDAIFGLKEHDRRRHVWAVGKTGTGKSTLIANMAIDDLKKDRGMAIIDPHGDLSEILLNYIPSHRINDVIYFNPADKDYPVVINPLEVTNKEEAELVVSGIVSIFNKIFGDSWGPRLEYILRNSLLTLAEVPNSTLKDIPLLLTNQSFRNKIVKNLKDEQLKGYWENEFEKMPEKLQQEAISPILNKVGQFVNSPMIRSVIGLPKSTISLDDVMNQGKILIANLSQGRLGEDNAALLGAMLITKLQLAAMHRVDIPEEERRDFYLYVDEFQNFATGSFIKIISEARKYRLNIMLANQYMAQIPDEVTGAILGNAGNIMTFALGSQDADILKGEFAGVLSSEDLVNLGKFEIATKLTIDGQVTRPFVSKTLPLPTSVNQNKEKVITVSRERWTKKLAK